MIRPWHDIETLTLSGARERYDEVEKAFAEVRRNYSGFRGWFKRDMREEDTNTLTSCVGVLLPLSLNDAVKTEAERRTPYNSTLHSKVINLNGEILFYASKFRNTGAHFLGMFADEID